MSKKQQIINSLRERLGSAEKIAQRLAARYQFEESTSGQSVRRWFREQRIPIKPLLTMLDMAGLSASNAFEFHPYLRKYFELKQ